MLCYVKFQNILLSLSTCCGLAGTFLTISSYRRVPCHLQDPLKGAALVYSLVFYFFFCRKVMGLQRIFSATTAVVGLFISVDYGLCDEFRCRGADVTSSAMSSANMDATTQSAVGWQGRAVWTLFYVIGVALWTLHLSLLEGHVITVPIQTTQTLPRMSLLTTVSRIVSNSEPLLPDTPTTITIPELPKTKPKALHLAVWLHGISFVIFLTLGWIDVIPGSGQVKSLSQFWSNTGNSFLCHFNIQHEVPDIKSHHETLEYLSNLTPYSIFFNRTVQNLRNKRQINDNNNKKIIIDNIKYFHTKINSHHAQIHSNNDENLIKPTIITTTTTASPTITTVINISNFTTLNEQHEHDHDSLLLQDHNNNNNNNNNGKHNTRKINTEKHLKKSKNHYKKEKHKVYGNHNNHNESNNSNNTIENANNGTNTSHQQGTPIKISHLILKSNRTGDCNQVRIYSWLLIFTYLCFIWFLYEFLIISESAVFTVAVVTGSLPLIGIFWSIFELTTQGHMAKIIWSPEITGELICSILGTPIIFLGLALLCRAHFHETYIITSAPRNYGLYSSLTSRIA